mgnify:CR=1 FL=1
MNILKILSSAVLFIILSLGAHSAFGQLYDFNGNADHYESTAYGADTLFVFYSTNADKVLAARHSSQDTSDFFWQRFNKDTKQFDSLLVHATSDYSQIALDSLYEQGMLEDAVEGLRVEVVSDQGSREVYNAWVVVDTLDKIHLAEYRNTCDQIKLEVQNLRLQDYRYYDLSALPADTNVIVIENDITYFQWDATADVSIYWEDTPLYEGDRVIGYIGSPFEMPYQESDYILELGNIFDNRVLDTIEDVPAKAVRADFTIDKLTPEGALVDYNPSEINEALLQVLFENQSKNANQYDWTGLNDSINILRGRDSILWQSSDETPAEADIPPYKPGKYPVRLSVSNDFGCADSNTYYHIRVDSSRIDSSLIPNVFTPDGNGLNDVFVLPKASNLSGSGRRGIVSMKWIEVSVFNRNGELVYRYDGDPFEWEGWRGKVRNSNRDAAEGIYLYVIKGRGYDGVMHENKQYSGFLYLFRQ